ncbi:RNA polymerase sigma factor [Antrihabitans cavernicola]|uniref:Sigma-70 family RNA polymerase sigma factor n=1 Tax=Antrihabitans cavernicola TaxID=2495913 RepID=A0A5A7SAJ2_9NOCA|nr:sigma-70 family RNA polymerase sigma factor [Spelaeibacter cavernicola]KAA0021857.1 sigma-70 family RNA polymerase sigma factor [Spelaeibacter cavernicola]
MGEEGFALYVAEEFTAAAKRAAGRFDGWADGEDAVQEALIRAWLTTEQGTEIRSLPAWITTVAHNVGLDTIRSRRAEERALRRIGLPQNMIGGLDRLERLGEVADAIIELPRRQAEVLVLHYYGDLSVAEIGEHLGITPGTVKALCTAPVQSWRHRFGDLRQRGAGR